MLLMLMLACKFRDKHLTAYIFIYLFTDAVDAVVKPTVSYGYEIWGTLCSGNLQPGSKGMAPAGLQIAFFRQLLKLRRGISPHVILAAVLVVSGLEIHAQAGQHG